MPPASSPSMLAPDAALDGVSECRVLDKCKVLTLPELPSSASSLPMISASTRPS
jgi:hypothetical protein